MLAIGTRLRRTSGATPSAGNAASDAAKAFANPTFAAPLRTSVVLDRGAGSATFTRTTIATITDCDGLVRACLVGEARFQGARRVQNGQTSTHWPGATGAGTTPTGWTRPAGTGTWGLQASVLADGHQADHQVAAAQRPFLNQGSFAIAVGDVIMLSCIVESCTVAPTGNIMGFAGGGATAGNTIPIVSATPIRYSRALTITSGPGPLQVRFGLGCDGNDTGDLVISHPMVEIVTGHANQNPSEYVSVGVLASPYHGANVDGVKYFDTLNGNTVSSGVVTEATGAAIPEATIRGYLAEQASTNVCLQSAALNVTWLPGSVTLGGSVTLPDGTTGTVNKLQETATTAVHFISQTAGKAASSLAYTFSIYVQKAERTFAEIGFDDNAGNGATVFVNLTTGAISTAAATFGAGFSGASATVTAAGSNFYRVTLTATTNTSTTIRPVIVMNTDGTTHYQSYAGTLNSGIYAWGAQLEANAPFATSYIPTTTASVTRNLEALAYPVAGNVLGTAGTCYAENWRANWSDGSACVVSAINEMIFGGNTVPARSRDGTASFNGASYTPAAGELVKLATSWGGSTRSSSAAGVLATGGTFDGDMSFGSPIVIGRNDTASTCNNGCIKNVKLWLTRLTDAQLQQMTTPPMPDLGFSLPLNDLGAGQVSLVPSVGTGPATFTRATTATTILANGLIRVVASGVPRSCYSPTGIYLGYLAEQASTNLLLQSADIATTWVPTGTTIGTAVAAPDSTSTAKKLQEDATTAQHYIVQSISKAASSLAYTASVYVKAAERTFAGLRVDDGAGNGFVVEANLSAVTVGTPTLLGSGWSAASATVTPAALGFVRITLTATSNAATTIRALVMLRQSSGVESYTGTVGSGAYPWGFQLEQLAFATSYIPTTTVAVTRNADVLTFPSAGNVNDGGPNSLYFEAQQQALRNAFCPGIVVSDGTNNNRIDMAFSGGATNLQGRLTVTNGGAIQADIQPVQNLTASTLYKTAARSALNDFALFSNGASMGTDTAGTLPSGMNVIHVGARFDAPGGLNGTIKNVSIWRGAMTDTQMQSLTR